MCLRASTLQATVLRQCSESGGHSSSLKRWSCSGYWTWRVHQVYKMKTWSRWWSDRVASNSSVWGCGDVSRLPDSLDSLKQLQTLDIRDTAICKLPKSIVKIKKLQYIRASMAETKRSLPVTSRMFCYWFFRFGPTMITGFGLRCPTALFSWLLFFSEDVFRRSERSFLFLVFLLFVIICSMCTCPVLIGLKKNHLTQKSVKW